MRYWWFGSWLWCVGMGGAIAAPAPCQLTVSIAASLGAVFKQFQPELAAHSGCQIALNIAGSGALVQQVLHGAPIDVIATADELSMDQLTKAQLVAERHDMIANQLVLITSKQNPLQLQSVADLRQPQVQQIAIGHPSHVPVGRYTQQSLQQQQLWPSVAAKMVPAANVSQVLDYVLRHEVQAGFVYRSDTIGQPVTIVSTLTTSEPIRYPAAVLKQTPYPRQAVKVVQWLRQAEAQQRFAEQGFTVLPREGADDR